MSSEKTYKVMSKIRLSEAIEKLPEYSLQEVIYAVCRKAGIKIGCILNVTNEEMYNAIIEMIEDEKE